MKRVFPTLGAGILVGASRWCSTSARPPPKRPPQRRPPPKAPAAFAYNKDRNNYDRPPPINIPEDATFFDLLALMDKNVEKAKSLGYKFPDMRRGNQLWDRWCAMLGNPEAIGGEMTKDMLLIALPTTSNFASVYLVPQRKEFERDLLAGGGRYGGTDTIHRSPYFDTDIADTLAGWILTHASRLAPGEALEVLGTAIQLYLNDSRMLSTLARQLVTKDGAAKLTNTQRVDAVHYISLAATRHQTPAPGIMHLLQPLHENDAVLKTEDVLRLLTALGRMKERRYSETIRLVSRREADAGLAHYSPSDLCFALHACTLLESVSHQYVIAALHLAPELAPSFNAHQLGNLCRSLSHLRTKGHTYSIVNDTCAFEMRRLLPVIVEKAEEFVGTFTVRDAKVILRCIGEFGVRHGLLFSKLTAAMAE